MRKLPKTLMIFGKLYRVKIVELDENLLGNCDYENGVINLSPNQKEAQRTHTFLHEIIHAILERNGIYQGLDDKFNEVISDAIATALLENFKLVLRDKRK